jgi:hypothetical protein
MRSRRAELPGARKPRCLRLGELSQLCEKIESFDRLLDKTIHPLSKHMTLMYGNALIAMIGVPARPGFPESLS